MRCIALVALLLIVLAGSSQAGLAPSKASQLINLLSGADCTCAGGDGTLIDTVVLPDGTTSPFAIPAKQVLVLDAWSWQTLASLDTLFFCLGTSPAAVSWTSTALNPGGGAFHEAALPSITVKSGAPICVASYAGRPIGVHMHGFLAADK